MEVDTVRPEKTCYEILYVSMGNGKMESHRGIKGLQVKTKMKSGVGLSQDRCDENMKRAFEAAKKLWNASDQSDRPRFD